jgi:hypothetical protein
MIYISVGYHDRMAIPVPFECREDAEAFLANNPHIVPCALLAYGDVVPDKLWLDNWSKFKNKHSHLNLEYTL